MPHLMGVVTLPSHSVTCQRTNQSDADTNPCPSTHIITTTHGQSQSWSVVSSFSDNVSINTMIHHRGGTKTSDVNRKMSIRWSGQTCPKESVHNKCCSRLSLHTEFWIAFLQNFYLYSIGLILSEVLSFTVFDSYRVLSFMLNSHSL